MNLYFSDTHLGHKNILKYTGRPFGSVDEMDLHIIEGLRSAEQHGDALICAGDFAMNIDRTEEKFGQIFANPELHSIVIGNHDDAFRYKQRKTFGLVIGGALSWRTNALHTTDVLNGEVVDVIVTHDPAMELPEGAYNVYGHYHNNFDHGMQWHINTLGLDYVTKLATSPFHINASVELHNYVPAPLSVLIWNNLKFQERLQDRLHGVPYDGPMVRRA